MRQAFFDFRVFYSFASSHINQNPMSLYSKLSKQKRREYAQRISEVNDGDFTPMIMSSSGGMCPEMHIALKHLARKMAVKQSSAYAKVAGLLRCKFAFAIMRSAVVCLRGSRSPWKRVVGNPLDGVELACIELRL